MAEYIERKRLKEAFNEDVMNTMQTWDPALVGLMMIEIDEIPAADVAPVVRGEWIKKPYLLGTSRFCSKCGENYGMPHGVFNYCPNCGAMMEDTDG